MDSLTHVVLGACVGEIIAGKKMGKRAMAWGALMNSLPDVDFVFSMFLSPTQDLIAHRGITHSMFFVVLITPLLSLIAKKMYPLNSMRYRDYLIFFFIEIFLHIFLDTFNVYGTGWWEPFSSVRYSWDFLFVADPLFTIGLLIVALRLLFARTLDTRRKKWATIAVSISAVYLIWGGLNKGLVDTRVKQAAAESGIQYQRYFSTPTTLNHQLFYCLLESSEGIYISYRSIWDGKNKPRFQLYERNAQLEEEVLDQSALKDLKQFSQGWYALKRDTIGIQFQDYRFGQILGWQEQPADFIFYYYIDQPDENLLVVQRGRVKGWNKEVLGKYIQRIFGKED